MRSARCLSLPLLPLMTALGLSAGCGQTYEFRGHNVILISIDTLRADHLSLYGYHRPTSPHLERLAKDAIVFDSFNYNGGGTLPSHMSMFTSLYPATHGVRPATARSLDSSVTTLTEVFKAAGYVTAGFVDGGWVRGKFGFRQGFDLYDDSGGNPETGRFANILPKVYDWLDDHYLERSFLFVHTYDVHSEGGRLPYHCPGDYTHRYTADLEAEFDGCREGRCATPLFSWLNDRFRSGELSLQEVFSEADLEYVKALYDGCINYVDDRLGELFDRLRELDLYDDSVIVVTSDHGEEFGEHGLLLHDQGGYEEFAHIPLIVKLPGSALGGTRVPHLAAMVDVMPTILDVAGLPVPKQAQGSSLMPAVLEDAPTRKATHMYSVLREGRWKYFSTEGILFDLEQDPVEQTDAASENPEWVERLEKRMKRLAHQDNKLRQELAAAAKEESEAVTLTEKEIRDLKALGYLDD